MAGGYFDDGTVDVALGEHIFATPVGLRRNVILAPHGGPATVLDSGGGVLDLAVTGQRVRANLGDAERYIYELLCALAESDPGTLGIEDGRGKHCQFGDAVCVGAAGRVHALKFADIEFDFLAPARSSQPAWGSIPSTPGTYGGTTTNQTYVVNGTTIGIGVGMRIEMARRFPLRSVPRARGARARGPASGAQVRLIVLAHVAVQTDQVSGAPDHNLAKALHDLERGIGSRPGDLTGNGNTYTDVVFDSVRPVHTDLRHTSVEVEFVKEL